MKKIVYFLLFFAFIVSSCEDNEYKDLNITHLEEEIDIRDFVGDLTSHIVILDANGEEVSSIDMGSTFYIVDNTEGGSDKRTWTITRGNEVITSEEQFVRVNFTNPGEVVINLTSERSSDGKSVSSSSGIEVLSIPITAGIKTDIAEEEGMLTVKTGDFITFEDNSMGAPKFYEWEFEGGLPATGDKKVEKIRYEEAGVYGVKYKALREDNPGEFVSDEIVKTAYINVVQREVRHIRAVATDNKIEVQFDEPLAESVPADAKSEFSITINTKGGAVLNPAVQGISVTGKKSLTLTFADQMYSDDEVLLTYTPTGKIEDATGLTPPIAFSDEPCVYGKSLVYADTEGANDFALAWGNEGGKFFNVNEDSAEYPMKPYQGLTCMAFTGAQYAVTVVEGFDVEHGDEFVIAYEALRTHAVGGALERRVHTQQFSGSNDAGGNWSQHNQNGGMNEWRTETKPILAGDPGGSGGTKGKVGRLYMTFMHYNGNSDDVLYVDNVRIYKPNPRP
jgi:PKD repeat protein